ncbi:cytochrome P450 [Pseudoduganella umbonata]|uniref:Cytochrome P450 n=1 Tax=Pseudoduganella umbonata TaxID=864828 RepID=A0A4P8HVK7_9BURK|nr:cytochrome P450 [Pseudoduganella umbonata]MBB3222280.1 cytochrome P450 [Pseudoduganella umbonata]QCP12505.1 cytochrome P450 [Pseudoduganella umbonata]
MSTAALKAPAPRTIADLPAPPGLPLLGNALQMKPSTVHLAMERWCRRYGPIFRARLGRYETVVLADSDAIAAVLRDRPDGFRRPVITAEVSAELGGQVGVFIAEGDAWRNQRRMVMSAFSPTAIRAYFERMAQVAQRLEHRWRAAGEREIDLSGDLKRYTVDVVAGLAFGADINTLDSGGDAIQEHVETVMAGVARRSLLPFAYWRWFKLPADRRLERSVRAVRDATDGFIAEARAAMAADPTLRERPANMLQAMLAAADQPGSGVDESAVAGNVTTMLLAGEDTTASALAWLIWLLWQNPEALARAQREVRLHAPALTVESIGALDYLEACALEAMRLKPPAPFLPLQALRDTTVMNVHLPKGTLLWCALRHDSVDAGVFPEPQRFDPERWLPGGGGNRQVALPFGAGPRTCPGRYLSLMELKVAMAVLLGRFDIVEVRARDRIEPAEVLGFVMGPTPLAMRLRAA